MRNIPTKLDVVLANNNVRTISFVGTSSNDRDFWAKTIQKNLMHTNDNIPVYDLPWLKDFVSITVKADNDIFFSEEDLSA